MILRHFLLSHRSAALLILTIYLVQNGSTGPMKGSSRLVREVYPEIEPENDGNQAQVCIVGDVVYGIDEPVPAEQPCLKCRCQPPGVQCETIKCAKKPGCKAIHRPNKCCPDYQCECHHEGKIYANGERLKTPPGGECKVCYCRGGEVQCAEVSCYVRTDCEAKRVPGQCCPKYDHCPPKEPLMQRPTINSEILLPNVNKKPLELWPITQLLQNSTNNNETQDANKIEEENATVENLIQDQKTTLQDLNKQIDTPKITIHEIIPEIKEIPITEPSTSSSSNNNKNVVEDSGINDVTDSDVDSSEISEVFQQPPPVLRIGDKLLFLKQGELVPEKDASTPTSVITIIGAEGLQRGFEDSAEIHEHSLFNNNSNDLEPKTSESTHILSLVKRKKPQTTMSPEAIAIETTSEMSFEETSPFEYDENLKDEIENSTDLLLTTNSNQTEISEINSTETENVEYRENATTILSDENPAYPPITDVMSPENIGKMSQVADNEPIDKSEDLTQPPESNTKILPQVLEIRSNKTVPQNTTFGEWLKNDNSNESLVNVEALLPDDILNETTTLSADDFTTIDEFISETNPTSPETPRSMESIEETSPDSGELTTPKNNHASIISSESASIEMTEADSSETSDMLKEHSTEKLKIDDVEIINKENNTDINLDSVASTAKPLMKDVEMITVKAVVKEAPEKIIEFPAKSIEKRENSKQDETDEIFRELESELNPDATEKYLSDDEDKQESDRIFKELLEETSTPRSTKKLSKDEQTLQKVSDAIARITLGGQRNSLDVNILGVLSNFFSSQYSLNGK